MCGNQVLGGNVVCLKKCVFVVREKKDNKATSCGCLQVFMIS